MFDIHKHLCYYIDKLREQQHKKLTKQKEIKKHDTDNPSNNTNHHRKPEGGRESMSKYSIYFKGEKIGEQELDRETARRYELTEGISISKEDTEA